MPIYTDHHAALLAGRAGQKWRPANGNEGDLFMDAMCGNCATDCNACDLLGRMFFHQRDDDEYPSELQIGKDGQPTCTAFQQAP